MRTVVPRIDRETYGALLTAKLPRPLRTKRDIEHAEKELLDLDEREERLTPEEKEYAEVLAILIEDYEDKHFPMPSVAPYEALKGLMQERSLRHRDIADLIGNKGLTTEILAGRREISKTIAKRLAEGLRVPIELFL